MAHLETPDIHENDVTYSSFCEKNMTSINDVTPLLTSFEDFLASPSTCQLPFFDFETPCADELPTNLNPGEMVEAILKDLGIDITPPTTISPNLTTPPKNPVPSTPSVITVHSPEPVQLCRNRPNLGNMVDGPAVNRQCRRNGRRSSGDSIRSTQQRIQGRRQTNRDLVVTKPQCVILKGAFSRTRWPSQFDIQEIATVTRLPQQRVRTWFEEERKMMRMRKRLFSEDVSSSSTEPRPKRRAALSRAK